LIRAHAYDGLKKDKADLATVFARWNTGTGDLTFICEVDGKSYRRIGSISPCPSVVYLPPGQHELLVEYRWANRFANLRQSLAVRAGSTYEVTAASADKETARFTVREMPPGFSLTYRDLAPAFFLHGDRQNRVVDPADVQ
jgi:hypothetical protein